MNQNSKIQALTVRFSKHLYNKICAHAEGRSITNAEALREIVQGYFNQQDEVARVEVMEAALLDAIRHCEHNLGAQINNLVQE